MISQTSEYALRAMTYLAMHEAPATGQEIARVTKVPPGYLAKIMQQLVKAGLLKSQRGMGGGFELAKNTEDISFLEVINAVDPIKKIESCPLGIESHGFKLCPLHKRLSNAVAEIENEFETSKLSELVDEARRPECISVPLTPQEDRARLN